MPYLSKCNENYQSFWYLSKYLENSLKLSIFMKISWKFLKAFVLPVALNKVDNPDICSIPYLSKFPKNYSNISTC